jgi:hypothetical protein
MLGLTTVAAVTALATAGVATFFMWLRRRALTLSSPDWSVLVTIAATALIGIAPFMVLRVLDVDDIAFATSARLWPWRGLALSVAGVLLCTHLSALIDWAYIRPHLRGLFGSQVLPCQTSGARHWSFLTRLWIGHRIVANAAWRIGAVVAIGFCTVLLVPADALNSAASNATSKGTPQGAILTVIGAAGAALLVFFINRYLPVLALVANPRISVGDHVVLAEEYGTGVERRPVYYVVDVAAEGVKLLELNEIGRPARATPDGPGRKHDRSLPLVDVPRLLRVRSTYIGCSEWCSKANPDCPFPLNHRIRPIKAQSAMTVNAQSN